MACGMVCSLGTGAAARYQAQVERWNGLAGFPTDDAACVPGRRTSWSDDWSSWVDTGTVEETFGLTCSSQCWLELVPTWATLADAANQVCGSWWNKLDSSIMVKFPHGGWVFIGCSSSTFIIFNHLLSTFQFLLCLSGCRGSVFRPLHGAQE